MRGRVLIADDHPLVGEALRMAIYANWPGVVVDTAGSLAELETLTARRVDYGLVLLDLMLPDAHGFSGLILVQKLLPNIPIALISSRGDAQTIASAHLLGAAAFLSKSTPMSELAAQIRRVADGEKVFPTGITPTPRDAGLVEATRRLETLSGAQLRILLALADGRLNKQIAADMGLTEATVKAHLTAIFKKLKVANRTQAILAAQPLLSAHVG